MRAIFLEYHNTMYYPLGPKPRYVRGYLQYLEDHARISRIESVKKSIELYKMLGEEENAAFAQVVLAIIYIHFFEKIISRNFDLDDEDKVELRSLLRRSRKVLKGKNMWSEAWAVLHQGMFAALKGEVEKASILFKQSRKLFMIAGDAFGAKCAGDNLILADKDADVVEPYGAPVYDGQTGRFKEYGHFYLEMYLDKFS